MDSIRDRAIAADESGDLPLAFELWGKLAETDVDGLASLKYGAVAIELGNWEVAEAALMEASRLKPRASIVMVFLGRLWDHRTDRDQIQSLQTAKQWYLKSLERKRVAPFLTLLGAVCLRLNEILEAKAAFEEAIVVDPNYDEAMYNLAVLLQKNDVQRCAELTRRAVAIDPEYALAHGLLGRTLQKLGDLDSAEQHFRKCLQIDSDHYTSNLYFGNLLAALGKNEEAEQTYRHAIELEPELRAGLRIFAKFLKSIGKVTEAAELLSKSNQIAR